MADQQTLADKYVLSADMQLFIERCESYFPDEIIAQGIAVQRSAYNKMTASFAREIPNGLIIKEQLINGVNTRHYQAENENSGTTILFAHGGGWYLGGLNSHNSFCADLAKNCQVNVIAIDYRLAPESPYPAALDDCYRVYKELIEQGITPVLMGDSAGANLMAALTHRCKEDKHIQAVAQFLIYPALALPLSVPSHKSLGDAPLLNYSSIEFCLKSYIPQCYQQSTSHTIFPLVAKSVTDLPPATVFAAQYDPLIDDALHYCKRLQQANVAAQCITINALVHSALHGIGVCEESNLLFESICAHVISLKTQQ